MSASSYSNDDEPRFQWNENVRSSYGANGTFLAVCLALSVVFIVLVLLLVKFFQNLCTVERAALRPPGPELKGPAGPISSVWNTLWRPSASSMALPTGPYQTGFHSASTRMVADSELDSFYTDTLPMVKTARI